MPVKESKRRAIDVFQSHDEELTECGMSSSSNLVHSV